MLERDDRGDDRERQRDECGREREPEWLVGVRGGAHHERRQQDERDDLDPGPKEPDPDGDVGEPAEQEDRGAGEDEHGRSVARGQGLRPRSRGSACPPLRGRDVEKDAGDSEPERQGEPQDAAKGVDDVQREHDLGRVQDAEDGRDRAAGQDQVARGEGRRGRPATGRHVGGARGDEPGGDQDQTAEDELPRAEEAPEKADDRHGEPGAQAV